MALLGERNDWGQIPTQNKYALKLRDYTITLGAGATVTLGVPGDYYHVIAASSDVVLEFDNGDRVTRSQGVGGSADYQSVTVTSVAAQTVTMALGFGTLRDSRATLNATVNSTVEPGNLNNAVADVTVAAATTTLLVAADATRKALLLSLDADQPAEGVRIGDATTGAAKGLWLGPGASVEIPSEAAVFAYNVSAVDTVDIGILPITRV